jgi:subtilisin family serine protease
VYQEADAYPAQNYAATVAQLAGNACRVQSRWLNAVSVCLDVDSRKKVAALLFVAGVQPVRSSFVTAENVPETPLKLSKGLAQMGGKWLQQEKLTGKGVHIGLIDAGFGDADKTEALAHLFTNKSIKAYRDFEAPSHTDFFRRPSAEFDDHGTDVLSLVAGLEPGISQYGGATGATFSLARTDNAIKEYRHEEDLWVNAMEWMDSLGVRLINSSLGYGLDFTDSKEDHTLADVNGKSSPATRAVDIASLQKGITVVVSAGNDGGDARWGPINMPADAETAIAVGSTYADDWQRVNYSGKGPESLPYIKPDVAVFSLLGTSFSAPLVAGGIACLMERFPNLKPADYANAIKQSGHLAGAPNNYLGHGVPDLHRAALVLQGKPAPVPVKHLKAKGQVSISTIEFGPTSAVFFHKKDARTVLRQGVLTAEKGHFVLNQEGGAKRSTLATPTHIWEVEWEQ